MKKIFSTLALIVFSVAMQAQINDENAQVRQASGYHGINVSSAFNVYLSQSNEEAVAVSAASVKDRDMITVEVKEGILYIGLSKTWKWSNGNKKLRAYISFKQLDKLNISGACDVFINGVLKADVLRVQQSGASDLKGKMDVAKLYVDLSGASDMTITGMATRLYVEASGASDFKGFDLVAESCEAKASGASDIRITVNKELSAEASGASDVKYRGSCTIREVKSSGSASVSRGR
jgi:Putative auto-transporter adhesin, head GIN domain